MGRNIDRYIRCGADGRWRSYLPDGSQLALVGSYMSAAELLRLYDGVECNVVVDDGQWPPKGTLEIILEP